MLLDLEDSQVKGPLEEDVVIIGGGAVGLSMLADRVRRGERTLLIEAGGAGLEDHSQDIVRSAQSLPSIRRSFVDKQQLRIGSARVFRTSSSS